MTTLNRTTVKETANTGTPGNFPRWGRGMRGGTFVLAAIASVYYMVFPANLVAAAPESSTTRLSEQGLYRSTYSAGAVEINQMHSWRLHVETPDGQPVNNAEITVDGNMPEHSHRLPTQPKVTRALGNGDYLVEGMKFQMGGSWVVDFRITANGRTDRVSFNLLLK